MPGPKKNVLKLGIVGCGAIGSQLVRAIAVQKVVGVKVIALTDINPEQARRLAAAQKSRPLVCSLTETVKHCDLIVEAAGMAAVPAIAKAVVKAGKDLLVLSIGVLIDHPEIRTLFRKHGCHLHFPSGAITGLDALKAAAAFGKISRVSLTTRKPPMGLAGAPFFAQKKINPLKLKKPTTIFKGTARRAVRLFPANVNVAAAVSLVGIGPDRTQIKIIADPGSCKNSHTLEVVGAFGSFTTITENIPAKDNPKTSFLAAASALAMLIAIIQGDRYGT